MTTRALAALKPGQVAIECRPGESRAAFIARLIATAPGPDAALAEDLRHWLPPAAAAAHSAAA
ncbi:MAG: hypothetical protein ACRDNK_11820 [Solirubrobacteraceae bacterium]